VHYRLFSSAPVVDAVRDKIPRIMASFVDESAKVYTNEKAISHNLHWHNVSPVSGETLCQIQTPPMVDAVVKASHNTFLHSDDWSNLSFAERGKLLQNMANVLQENATDLAVMETLDTGLPISQVRSNHVPSAVQTLRYYAAVATQGGLPGRIMDVPFAGGHPDSVAFTRREPLGVCVGIGGWNYPLVTMVWKIAPALCMGNTIIYKPSECTPLTSLYVASELWSQILPPGVLQVMAGGLEVGQRLVEHPLVSKVSITGSTATGIKVAKKAAETLKRTTLELGGKSALLVFDDCDLDSAVRVACEANFINNGQVCSNATRIFVQGSIVNEFVEKLCQRLDTNVVMGDPLDPETNVGPMMMHPHAPSQHFDRVMGFLERAEQDDAIDVLYGGNGYHHDTGGYFVEPTVLLAKNDTPEIVREEVFGPIMTILAFDTEEEAIERANSSIYGLGAGVMTKDVMRAHRMSKRLQAGNVWVNNWNLSPVEVCCTIMKRGGGCTLSWLRSFFSCPFFLDADAIRSAQDEWIWT
jgi:betaine-aldehyde dehydrogenase